MDMRKNMSNTILTDEKFNKEDFEKKVTEKNRLITKN